MRSSAALRKEPILGQVPTIRRRPTKKYLALMEAWSVLRLPLQWLSMPIQFQPWTSTIYRSLSWRKAELDWLSSKRSQINRRKWWFRDGLELINQIHSLIKLMGARNYFPIESVSQVGALPSRKEERLLMRLCIKKGGQRSHRLDPTAQIKWTVIFISPL